MNAGTASLPQPTAAELERFRCIRLKCWLSRGGCADRQFHRAPSGYAKHPECAQGCDAGKTNAADLNRPESDRPAKAPTLDPEITLDSLTDPPSSDGGDAREWVQIGDPHQAERMAALDATLERERTCQFCGHHLRFCNTSRVCSAPRCRYLRRVALGIPDQRRRKGRDGAQREATRPPGTAAAAAA